MRAAAEAATFFHPETLAQLLMVRAELRRDDPVDGFLLAAIAGILHGSRASALTDAMPNTFSMAPAYATRWLAARDEVRGTGRPERDLFALLARRITWLLRDGRPATRGIAIAGDARTAGGLTADALRRRGLPDRVRLVVTSPPYLGLVRYGRANWLRLWLLGEDPTRVDASLDAPRSAVESSELLREVLTDLRPILADDAIVVCILGDVESHRGRRLTLPLDLAAETWQAAARARRLPAGRRERRWHRCGPEAHPAVGRTRRRRHAHRAAARHHAHGARSATRPRDRGHRRRPGVVPWAWRPA